MRPLLKLALVFSLPALLGCPNDLTATSDTDGTSTGTTTSGADAVSTAADESAGSTETGNVDSTAGSDDTGGPNPLGPVLNCDEEYDPLPVGTPVQVGFDEFTLEALELCPDLATPAAKISYPMFVYYPEDPVTGELLDTSPPSPRPWIVVQHGNSDQRGDGYDHIIHPLVELGFVVFSPDPGVVDSLNAWVHRSELTHCSLRWVMEEYDDEPALGQCFGLLGHSNGGSGVIAAGLQLGQSADPLFDRLGAAAAIAPASFQQYSADAEYNFPLLVLAGSHDHDTQINSIENYEAIANEGALDRVNPLPGSEAGRVGEKVLIEAFDVSHSAFGGVELFLDPVDVSAISVQDMRAKGEAIAGTYIPAYFAWQFLGDLDQRAMFTDNEVPGALNQPEWWDYLSQWTGAPLIFGQYQMGDRRGIDIERFPIATFESGEPESELDYGGGGMVVIDPSVIASFNTAEDIQNDLYPGALGPQPLTASTYNRALYVEWSTGLDEEYSVAFDFSPPDFESPPTHLSFRAHNVFDGWDAGAPDCTRLPSEEPLSLDVQVRSGATVGTTRVSELVVQDHSFIGTTYDCDDSQTLYTTRIPLSCLEPAIDATQIESVGLSFGENGASQSGAVVIDSFELTYSPEDSPNANCDHLELAPAESLESYVCGNYSPEDFVGFAPVSSPRPGEPVGDLFIDETFARFIAARPSMVTTCDNTRYELATVQADGDGDGAADASHDVRSLDAVAPTDLASLLGFEEGDSAITINEPGKPDTNAVELYDYGSFFAAFRRFSALDKLEVRFLRKTVIGVHEPVQIGANTPAGVNGPSAPISPAPYLLPTGATYVSTSADLINALALPTGQDIIVADGDYTWTGPVTVGGPHRLWSETLLGATVHFGLTYAGNANRTGGLELHGLAFQVDDASMTPAGVGSTHVLFTWGQGGEDVLVEDCTFDGDLTIGDAIGAFAPSGLIVRRTEISNFWGYGIIAKQGAAGTVLSSEPLLEDLSISSIFGANPGSSNGAWENGLLLGNNGTIRRVDIRDVGWSAILLYNDATGVSIEDVFIDYAGPDVWAAVYTQARGAGIWLGHSHDVEIARVRIESHVFLGINAHWDQGNADPFLNTTPPRNHNIVISDLYSRAYKIGVHLDLGVEDAVVRSSRFEHAWMAGVLDNNQFEDDWGWHPCPGGEEICLDSLNRTEDIDCYLQDGISCIAHHHNGGANKTPPTGWPSHPNDYVQPGGLWNRNNAAYPTDPGGGGDSSGGQVDSSTSG